MELTPEVILNRIEAIEKRLDVLETNYQALSAQPTKEGGKCQILAMEV